MPMQAEYASILYETADHTAWITLNRPEKRNAQNDELRAEMSQALERAGLDDDVYVVVITGSGDQAFSARADIDEFPAAKPQRRRRQQSSPASARDHPAAAQTGHRLGQRSCPRRRL